MFLVTDPAAVKRVLQDNADNYGRKTRSVDALRDTLGNGLLTTTGPAWWRNRRLAQPSFHKQRLAGFAGIMAEASADFVERLARAGAGGRVVRSSCPSCRASPSASSGAVCSSGS